jgi:hypothetical protein
MAGIFLLPGEMLGRIERFGGERVANAIVIGVMGLHVYALFLLQGECFC